VHGEAVNRSRSSWTSGAIPIARCLTISAVDGARRRRSRRTSAAWLAIRNENSPRPCIAKPSFACSARASAWRTAAAASPPRAAAGARDDRAIMRATAASSGLCAHGASANLPTTAASASAPPRAAARAESGPPADASAGTPKPIVAPKKSEVPTRVAPESRRSHARAAPGRLARAREREESASRAPPSPGTSHRLAGPHTMVIRSSGGVHS